MSDFAPVSDLLGCADEEVGAYCAVTACDTKSHKLHSHSRSSAQRSLSGVVGMPAVACSMRLDSSDLGDAELDW